jgi:hypothetical protein
MSTPTQPTEAHRKLWTALYLLAHRNVIYLEANEEKAIQLLCDSEARAVEAALESHNAQEKCITCKSEQHPSLVEGGECIYCTLTAERVEVERLKILCDNLECQLDPHNGGRGL